MSMQSSLKSLESQSLSGSFYSDNWSCYEIRRLQEALLVTQQKQIIILQYE
jgi:hypothetical protein